ncbi:MAG: flippase activity-associated protein Agl23 [Candidatus Aminicenantaceae bacterium]
MMNKKAYAGLFLIIILASLLFRALQLDLRPMHHDEANQAVKFGILLEEGQYFYDKKDHHGPSLYYFTLPFAWIASAKDLSSLNETILRLVPAIFGTALLFLFFLLKDGLGWNTMLVSCLLAALSPAIVYYNRFYIQETILVFALIGLTASGWKYAQNHSPGWAVAAGIFAGIIYSTKETCIILFVSLLGALLILYLSSHFTDFPIKFPRLPASHLIYFLCSAVVISFVLYSSFFQNLKGPVDSILAFKSYLSRASEYGWHIHPWYYYFKLLGFSKFGSGPLWSESLILLLAVAGSISIFIRGKISEGRSVFIRFVLFYTILAAVIYSLIPYKTPWNLLPFYMGFVMLAGRGAVFLIKISKSYIIRPLIFTALALGIINLGIQSYKANFKFYENPQNPYVYAQTSHDFIKLTNRIQVLTEYHPEGKHMLIKVIAGPYQTWPLPWYLRGFKRVGYWQNTSDTGNLTEAPVIISSLEETDKIMNSLQDLYITEYYQLRPGVLMALHIKKDLWNSFLESRQDK